MKTSSLSSVIKPFGYCKILVFPYHGTDPTMTAQENVHRKKQEDMLRFNFKIAIRI